MPHISTIGNASARPYGFTVGGAQGLYAFTTFTFTNAGATGRNGPTLSNCLSSYDTASNPWLTNTAFFNVVTQGYQLWTIPKTGTYRVTVAGAKGGSGNSGPGGFGAFMRGDLVFTAGDKVRIVVGQAGTTDFSGCGNPYGSGGGGSFVLYGTTNNLHAAAGGGGGSSTLSFGNQDGAATLQGRAGGGTNGGAPGSLTSPPNSDAGSDGTGCTMGGDGGAGMNFNSYSAISIYGGALGGNSGVPGGFGGGGSTKAYCGGGGGGYTGGGGGGLDICSCMYLGSGGGGGSYPFGTNVVQTSGGNTTSVMGYVTFTLL